MANGEYSRSDPLFGVVASCASPSRTRRHLCCYSPSEDIHGRKMRGVGRALDSIRDVVAKDGFSSPVRSAQWIVWGLSGLLGKITMQSGGSHKDKEE